MIAPPPSEAEVEAAARAMARLAHGPIKDLNDLVEYGEPREMSTPVGKVYTPRPLSAPLWILYSQQATAALQAAAQDRLEQEQRAFAQGSDVTVDADDRLHLVNCDGDD